MFKKAYWYILKRYVRKNRDIIKVDQDDEMKLFLFSTPEDTEKLIRALLTNQTIKHWEAGSDEERLLTRGAAIMLKVLRDGHRIASEVYDEKELDKSLIKWKSKKAKSLFRKYFIY